MFFTTGLHDMILAAEVKAIVTDRFFPTGFQDAITMPHIAIMATAVIIGLQGVDAILSICVLIICC